MLAFNHVLAGSIIAVIVPAPLVPFVALGSHFLLDLFPHFGRSKTVYPYTTPFKVWLVFDGLFSLIGLGLAIWLFPSQWFIICVGAFFGLFPDMLWPLYHHGPKWLDKFLGWAEWIQWGERPYGWIFDALYGGIFVFTLFALAA